MRELIQVELYKMWKRKCFLLVFIFNGISLLYGFGILLNWSWVSFNGKFDIIQYIGAIWQLMFLIGLPLIFFMYIGASILGGEKSDGQILLEITRVANRKRLIIAKAMATLLLVLYYFITNIIVSVISYTCLVHQTIYATPEWVILDRENINLLITCLFGCIYIVISVFFAMYMSIKYGAVTATIVGIALYAAMSMLARISAIRMWIPGYFALIADANIELESIVQQSIWCGIIILFFLYLMKKKMNDIDL